jgi:DNA-binding IclR family transcriptional regulator
MSQRDRDQIEIILRLWLDLTRQIHQGADPTRPQRFGARAGRLLIMAAVLATTLDRRPMTAHKLAGYVGMPRPTVIRHLRQLEREGKVERDGRRRYSLTASELERMLNGIDLAAIAHQVRAAAAQLLD